MAKRKKPKRVGGGESPTSSCLMLCDDVLISTARGKQMIQGVIGTIAVPSLPAVIGPYAAFVRMSNVYTGTEITFSLQNASTDEMVFAYPAKHVGEGNPLDTHTLVLPIPPFEIRTAGRYIFAGALDGQPAFVECVIMVRAETTDGE